MKVKITIITTLLIHLLLPAKAQTYPGDMNSIAGANENSKFRNYPAEQGKVTAKLDSSFEETLNMAGTHKEVYTYYEDVQKIATRSRYFRVNEEMSWIPEDKTEWAYDEQGNEIKQIEYNYSGEEWMPWLKYEREYGVDTSSNASYEWDFYNWIGQFKSVEFNDEDNKKNRISYAWDTESKDWELYSKDVDYAQYNEEDSTIFRETYTWNEEEMDWNLSEAMKTAYIFDSGDGLAEVLRSSWDAESETWVNGFKMVYTYYTPDSVNFNSYKFQDDTGWIHTSRTLLGLYNRTYTKNQEFHVYNFDTEKWELWITRKVIFNEDGNIQLDELVHYFSNQGWKHEYKYSSVGNREKYNYYLYDSTLVENWFHVQEISWEYDLSLPFANVLLPPYQFKNKNVVSSETIKDKSGDNEYHIIKTFYYSEIETGIPGNSPNSGALKLWPNPASSFLQWNSDAFHSAKQIRITDITGRTVLKTSNSNIHEIDISHLPNGFYYFTIIVPGGQTSSASFIIQR